jgi:hypothetical protein
VITDDDIRTMLRTKAAEATVSDDAWTRIADRLGEPEPKANHLPRRLAAVGVAAAVAAGVVVLANRPGDDRTPMAQSTSTTSQPTATTVSQRDPNFVRSVVEDWLHDRVPGVVPGDLRQTDNPDGSVTVRFAGGELATELHLHPTNGGQGLEVASATSDLLHLDDPTYDDADGLVATAVAEMDGMLTMTYVMDGHEQPGGHYRVAHTEEQHLGYPVNGATAFVVRLVLRTDEGVTAVVEQPARRLTDPAKAVGSYVAVWPATDAVGLSTYQSQVNEGRRDDLLDPVAVAGGWLSELLPRDETPTSFELGKFQQGDASSGEVPYTLSDGSRGTVLVRTMGGPKAMWFVSGATSDALDIAKVRHEPEDLVADVHATATGTLRWTGATDVDVQAGQTVGISRHDGPTVQSGYPIVIRLMDGDKTLGIVARLA